MPLERHEFVTWPCAVARRFCGGPQTSSTMYAQTFFPTLRATRLYIKRIYMFWYIFKYNICFFIVLYILCIWCISLYIYIYYLVFSLCIFCTFNILYLWFSLTINTHEFVPLERHEFVTGPCAVSRRFCGGPQTSSTIYAQTFAPDPTRNNICYIFLYVYIGPA